MRARILAALRGDARAWWYHRMLREQGRAVEARERERASLRGKLGTFKRLRAGEVVIVGAWDRSSCIQFAETAAGADARRARGLGCESTTVSISGCHAGEWSIWLDVCAAAGVKVL